MDLLVVESPTKARTISRFLGNDFKVLSTTGHIRDLPKKKIGVEVKKQKNGLRFDPQYVWMEKKEETIKALRKEIKQAKKVYLSTDPDREGEAIAYHVFLLDEKKKDKFIRSTFHEITGSAIKAALKKGGKIDLKLVDAQVARRTLDRLVGYKLSPLLWRKIRRGLSAGRVQSVVVRLIVEKEKEIEAFKPEEYWEIWGTFLSQEGKKRELLAKLVKENGKNLAIDKEKLAKETLTLLRSADYKIGSVQEKATEQRPVPPFTTSTLQQSAARKFNFTSKRTMRAAQGLYEKGLITYHRTDSLSLSGKAVETIRKLIEKEFGKQFLPEKANFYKTKSKSAQEAHEAIRPTRANLLPEKAKLSGSDEKRLYSLVWKRAIGSQMKPAVWDKLVILVSGTVKRQAGSAGRQVYDFRVEGKSLNFAGWLELYKDTLAKQENLLPKFEQNEEMNLKKLDPKQKFTQPPARYSEASLIKELEKKGIGRPSTYAPIVSTIQARQYVEKDEGRFKPTPLGTTVNDFLVEYFPKVMDFEFTARMEEGLDNVAHGEQKWQALLGEFYGPFDKKLEQVTKKGKRKAIPTEKTKEKCPKCKKANLVIRIGRFGKFLSCDRFPDCDYTAPFIQKIEGVKCSECGGEIVIRRTKKGKQFFGCSKWPKCKWASWKKPKIEK